jgi:hypothetical protein
MEQKNLQPQNYVEQPKKMTGEGIFGGLTPKAQFWYGLVGGWFIILYHIHAYANSLTAISPFPPLCFKSCLQCLFWLCLPTLSGLLSRICEPHHRLVAVFEGASLPTLFLFIAKDFQP